MKSSAISGCCSSTVASLDFPFSLRYGAFLLRSSLMHFTCWIASNSRGLPGTPHALRGGVTAKQMVLSVRVSSATTRCVVRGSRFRSTHSTDACAIGYISLGSLNATVKALEIDGAAATVENIKAGVYNVARPFNIATLAETSDAAQEFIGFIMSREGQTIIENNGYIAVAEDASAFAGAKAAGKVVVAGSSSVTPVMEKLKEAYEALNPNVEIELQQSDSSSGMTSTRDGVCDIGMASRALKDSELEAGLVPMTIAMDGIAVIVSNDNEVTGLTTEQVRSIYMGETTDWSEVNE